MPNLPYSISTLKNPASAVLQIAPGGGFTQSRLGHHLIHGKSALILVKQGLHPRQRILLNAFTAVILAVVFRLELIQRINVLLIDNLPDPLLFGELHKAFQRLAEPFQDTGLRM
jgi:hypothetical protein